MSALHADDLPPLIAAMDVAPVLHAAAVGSSRTVAPARRIERRRGRTASGGSARIGGLPRTSARSGAYRWLRNACRQIRLTRLGGTCYRRANAVMAHAKLGHLVSGDLTRVNEASTCQHPSSRLVVVHNLNAVAPSGSVLRHCRLMHGILSFVFAPELPGDCLPSGCPARALRSGWPALRPAIRAAGLAARYARRKRMLDHSEAFRSRAIRCNS